MMCKVWICAFAALLAAACAGELGEEQPDVSTTTQASYYGNYGQIEGQCTARCSAVTGKGYDDYECVADPCANGECEIDNCDEVALYAANRNLTAMTWRCTLGSVLYDHGSGGQIAHCDPDGDGKVSQDKLDLCCTKLELRPEIHGIGKAIDENYQTGPESFMVPDSLPPNAPYTLNDFCPRTQIAQTETLPIHGDATRTSNAAACNGKPTVQWQRTEIRWPNEPSYEGLWKEAMKCGSDVLSWAVAIFELWARKKGDSLFPKIAGVLTGGTGALGSCVEMYNKVPDGETSKKYVTWEATTTEQGQRGQFSDPPFYTSPTWEHYDTNETTWSMQGTQSQTLQACRRHIQGRFAANRRVRQWSFWQGEWVRSEDQYRVGFRYFAIPGATFEIEASEPCICAADADSFGINCNGKKTAYAGGEGAYIITSQTDNRKCVKHCFQTSNCMTYDCDQPEPACPLSDYFPDGTGSGSGSGSDPGDGSGGGSGYGSGSG